MEKLTSENALRVCFHHYRQVLSSELLPGFRLGINLALEIITDPSSQVAPAWIKEYQEALLRDRDRENEEPL